MKQNICKQWEFKKDELIQKNLENKGQYRKSCKTFTYFCNLFFFEQKCINHALFYIINANDEILT